MLRGGWQAGERRALAIGGLDPSAGAGVLLDAFTFAAVGLAPLVAVTTVTAQNSSDFAGAWPVEREILQAQLSSVLDDGPIACVKVGAIGSIDAAEAVATWIGENRPRVVVVDPVVTSSSGGSLVTAGSPSVAVQTLLSAADVITPNAAEAAALSGVPVDDAEGAARAALALSNRLGCAVLVTGIRAGDDGATDVLARNGAISRHTHPLVSGVGDVRGTGCMLSTALCAHMALGRALSDAVDAAHATVAELVTHARPLGRRRLQVDLGELLR
ncbi:MAG: bifunctional hydroxymethylpyrimidine kinase/phosphomethylpyrimidine kinase [Coriobacteriales bacterium]|nr:bifunctional hydroxymethylpyrimidine kinase/phosphomethylpyrimidine kinase [Coriobacteriales bacterium]